MLFLRVEVSDLEMACHLLLRVVFSVLSGLTSSSRVAPSHQLGICSENLSVTSGRIEPYIFCGTNMATE